MTSFFFLLNENVGRFAHPINRWQIPWRKQELRAEVIEKVLMCLFLLRHGNSSYMKLLL